MPNPSPLREYVGDHRPRILAVDDERVIVDMLATILTRWGCEVQTALSGAEALATVRKFEPDVILLDVLMPGQSGFEVCQALRDDPLTQHIPVIFITGLEGDAHVISGLETGGRGYITKPFDFTELATGLGGWLRQKYADDEVRARKSKTQTV